MASFSTTHPFAYHAFPLTAARSIWTSGALLGKDDQGSAGQARRTVADTDRRLGFSRYVHLSLPAAVPRRPPCRSSPPSSNPPATPPGLLNRAPQKTPSCSCAPRPASSPARRSSPSSAPTSPPCGSSAHPRAARPSPRRIPRLRPRRRPLGPRRQLLDDYLAGRRPDRPNIDFDAIRRKLTTA